MGKKNHKNPPDMQKLIPPGHKAPTTRREFLAYGLMPACGAVVVPSIVSVLAEQQAHGAELECKAEAASESIPAIIYECSGGASFAYSNVLVGIANGNGTQTDFMNDKAAALLGCPANLNPRNDPNMADGELGLLFHAYSGFLAGLRAGTSPETRANMDGMVICGRTADDTADVPINPAYYLAAAGGKGSLVDIIGNGNSMGQGRLQVPDDSLNKSSRAQVRNANSAILLVKKGLLGEFVNGDEVKILNAIRSMSAKRLAKFNAQSFPEQLRILAECGYVRSVENMVKYSQDMVDPSKDEHITAARQINNAGTDARIPAQFSNVNPNADTVSAVAKLVLEGYAGVGTIESGGFDYHGNSRQQQIRQDYKAGRDAALAFEMARLKQKPLVMVFVTDGSCSARGTNPDNSPEARGLLSFSSDDGTKSSSFMLVYDPKGKPTSTGRRQLGGYLESSGSADPGTPVGNNPINMAKAILLNYLALSGKLDQFTIISSSNPFIGDLEKYIAFDKRKV